MHLVNLHSSNRRFACTCRNHFRVYSILVNLWLPLLLLQDWSCNKHELSKCPQVSRLSYLVRDMVFSLFLWYLEFLVPGYLRTNRRHWKLGTVKVCSYHLCHSLANNARGELNQCSPLSWYAPVSMGLAQLERGEINIRVFLIQEAWSQWLRITFAGFNSAHERRII